MDTRRDDRRRRRGAAWLWLLLLLALAAAIGLIAAFAGGGGGDKSSSSSKGGVKGAETSLSSSGTVRAGSTDVLERAGGGGLVSLKGRAVTAKNAPVVSVVGDEVFWIGSGSKRVLVHLTHTAGESAPHVVSGDRVSFTGTLAANGMHDASTWGITKREDSSLYNRQKVHVETSVSTLKVKS